MPKQKTRKGIAKRIHITRRGKIMRAKAGRRHLLSGKSRKRKRKLRRKTTVAPAEVRRMRRALR